MKYGKIYHSYARGMGPTACSSILLEEKYKSLNVEKVLKVNGLKRYDAVVFFMNGSIGM
jgi:hypothetical protein